jgi:hypothetical protein
MLTNGRNPAFKRKAFNDAVLGRSVPWNPWFFDSRWPAAATEFKMVQSVRKRFDFLWLLLGHSQLYWRVGLTEDTRNA